MSELERETLEQLAVYLEGQAEEAAALMLTQKRKMQQCRQRATVLRELLASAGKGT